MRKSLLLSLALVALVALAITPVTVLAGKSCGSVEAKLTSSGDKACSGTANAKLADGKHCDYDGKCETISISVKGMTCGGCENGLTTALKGQDGVVKVLKVSHKDNLAVLCFDPTKTKSETLTKLISSKGYEAQIVPAVAVSQAVGSKDGAAGCSTMSKEECAKKCGSKGAQACASKKKVEADKADGSL